MIGYILPELILIFGAIFILLVKTFREFTSINSSVFSSIFLLVGVILLAIPDVKFINSDVIILNQMFVTSKFTAFVKIVSLLITVIAIIYSRRLLEKIPEIAGEFLFLMLTACLGSMLIISSNSLFGFYVGSEVMSFSLYILIATRKNDLESSEVAMKYFILGSLASGIILFGISIIYGFSGIVDLHSLSASKVVFENNPSQSLGVIAGFVMFLVGIFFKLAIAPFHVWVSDIYKGTPSQVLSIIATLPKFVLICFFIKLSIIAGEVLIDKKVLTFVAILSMIIGSIGGIYQTNIKRIVAYSGILNIGFALVGVISHEAKMGILYMIVYILTNLGLFGFLALLNEKFNKDLYNINSFAGFGRKNKALAMSVMIILFSFVGLPPLLGFFSKFYIIIASISAGLYFVAIVAVLSTVVAAFYYIRIVKIFYFDEINETFNEANLLVSDKLSAVVLHLIAFISVIGFLYIKKFLDFIGYIFGM